MVKGLYGLLVFPCVSTPPSHRTCVHAPIVRGGSTRLLSDPVGACRPGRTTRHSSLIRNQGLLSCL
jgi:hypothetical protein